MQPRTIFSGIQPTGIPHLGNLLGALLNWVRLQESAKENETLIYSIVGWHALTLPQDPDALRQSRSDMLAVLLAIGIDPKRSILFYQEDNAYHTDLAWLFNCITSVGKLNRMTTWKSRLATAQNSRDEEVDESLLNAGLLTYPVLQAADILLYRATHVPVGEDQRQHIELSRDIADAFNYRFCKKKSLFIKPECLTSPTPRVLSLRDSTSKMSKSAPDTKSRILLTDTDKEILQKIRSAVTDSSREIAYDPENRPGVANLLTILSACTGEDVHSISRRLTDKGSAALKNEVAEAVIDLIRKPREEFQRIRNETAYLENIADEGAAKARKHSAWTMQQARDLVGLPLRHSPLL
ncbi:tryptophanyl-tRNA synthetase [Panus rudis PR-1116 ss-1]|nr:tryptophanyl-tRNA synthetase [Panus rudis PR-1116 ss-1]